MTPQTPNDTFSTSAPTSPRRISMEVGGLCLFSVPTSPNRIEDSSFNDGDEFEFDISCRFDVDGREVESKRKSESRPEKPKESLPAMSYADELFCDGKVMQLKPSPRLQHHKQRSILSSPRSPSGGLRLWFQRRSLGNDDFDPFMTALKNVKEEESQAKNHRRSRSMSPFREITTRPKETNGMFVSKQKQINEMGLILSTKQSDSNSNKTMENNEPAEPKGVVFVKVGNEDSTMEGGESGKQTKGQKMKNLMFRSGSMRAMSNENKGKCHGNGKETRPKLKRKFSLKAMGITPRREEKNASQVTLKTLVRYRPKLLLCMGYGAKNGK
ncbi:F-box family protein isoform 1 [Hibiscus syriacus]|uniref:F-box family protein isoform 1 n=1 Tax=Hibiscus syriacus TaxID=106335 RepID=A0A6A2XXI3_HIBSY|nr:uncharacterized protein LOC120179901 [Hibiscus syriacus]KAE8666976.1 F-box family protein isoform 1 [Hibiscus syriacus]